MVLKSTIFLIVFFYSFNLFSQQGIPFIRNYDPDEYENTPQVWDITQDNRGLMYFAAKGVLEFDGVKWRTINLPKRGTVRSLSTDTVNNVVYVGGVGTFGFLKPDSIGNLVYVSLSEQLDSANKNFFDVWKTNVGKDGVYFSTDNVLYRYSTKSLKQGKNPFTIWKKDRIFLLFNVNGEIYTGLRGKGIVKVEGDSLVEVVGNKNLQKELTWFMLPYEKEKILIGNQRGGLSIYDPSSSDTEQFLSKEPYFDPVEIAKTDSFLFQNQLNGGVALKNGNYALATIRSGIIIINKKGKIVDHIYLENGLQSQTVHYLFQDNQEGLWAALTFGISRVEANSPIRQWNIKSGIAGSIYNIIRSNNNIYASSNLGLFILKNGTFQPIAALTGPNAIQCFVLENIKIPGKKDQLLACATNGIYDVKGDIAKPILRITTFQLYQSPVDPSICYVADENNIISIRYDNEKWQVEDTIFIANDYPSNFIIDKQQRFWFIDEGKPLMLNLSSPKIITNFKSSKYADNLEFNGVELYNGKVVFITNLGLWQFDSDENIFYQDKEIFNGLLLNKNIIQFKEVSKNEIWLGIKNDKRVNIQVLKDENGKYFIDSIQYKRLPNFEEFRNDGDSILWAISSKAIFQFDIKKSKNNFTNTKALNRLVIINGDSVIFKGVFFKQSDNERYIQLAQSKNQIPELTYYNNNVGFEFALPCFDDESKNLFSYCLVKDNAKESWSAWSNETKKEYTNLSDGEFIFKVKAKNIYGIESAVSEYHFVILTPWFKSLWAYFIYFVFCIVFLLLLVRFYTIRLKKKNQLLEKIVKERTKEIWEKKEEISVQRDNLQLLTEDLKQYNEEIRTQNDELLSQRNIVQNQKELLETINFDIKSSIEYAKRIQNSALPDMNILKNHVNDFFILFKPRDIVSGDFYWFARVEEQTIIAAADCTGHGVPGALMSILGMSLLKEIVVGEYITHPGVILRKLRKGIIQALKQTDESSGQDGMDIALISIDDNTKVLQYAGANNSLYIIRNKTLDNYKQNVLLENEKIELIELKSDNMPVGIYLKMDKYNTHEIQLKGHEKIYMFSDGFADQFGGKKGKKYKYQPFKKLLFDQSHYSMIQQKDNIEQIFNEWKGSNEQIDDLVLIGIEI